MFAGRRLGIAMAAGWLGSIAAFGAVAGPAQAAPDNLLRTFGDPVHWYRLYSSDDGASHLVEMSVPVTPGHVGTRVLFNQKTDDGVIAYWPDGFKYDWHNPSRPNVILYLQGVQVITTSDGIEHRINPGTVILVEDLKGRGHRYGCEAKEGQRICLYMQVGLAGPYEGAR
jgi:hypothetical protein